MLPGVRNSPSGTGESSGSPRFWFWLALLAAVGFAVRVVFLFVAKHPFTPDGDALYYHEQANALAHGKGFLDPYAYLVTGRVTPGADHPPLYTVVLAMASLLGFDTPLGHQFVGVLLGTLTVVLVGLAGRRIGGPTVGLVAAFLAAVYPALWINDALLLSETLQLPLTALVVLLAYRYAGTRRLSDAAWLGVSIGLAALARAELLLLPLFVVLPVALLCRSEALRRRVLAIVVSVAATGVVLLPWFAYNEARFAKPVTMTTQLQPTLVVANCDDVYYGPQTGWWSFNCLASRPDSALFPNEDNSQRSARLGPIGKHYIRTHLSRLPVVMVARLGRTFSVYHPWQQSRLTVGEGRPYGVSVAAVWSWWALALLSIPGLVLLRRRPVSSWPVVGLLLNTAVTVLVIYGHPRFRGPADIAVVLLAALTLTAGWQWLRHRAPAETPESLPTSARSEVPA